MVSGSVVRTTHLTGLFTDIGIEGAQLISNYNDKGNRQLITQKLTLHLIIAFSFLLGGIIGGFLYAKYLFMSFLLPVGLLVFASIYDITYNKIFLIKRKNRIDKISSEKIDNQMAR